MMKKIPFILILILFLPLLASAQVKVQQAIDSVEMWIGSQAHLKVSVQAKKGQKVLMPLFKNTEQIVPGVEVLDNGEETTRELDNGITETVREYTLTSFDDTLYYIPGVKVRVDGKEYQGNNLALKVVTLPVDTLHPENFFPPHDVQDPPFQWSEWRTLIWLILADLLIVAIIVFVYYRLKNNKPIKIKLSFKRKLPPHEVAMNAINEIKTSGMTQNEDQKAYYTRLTDVLRDYMEARFGFNAKEMVTTEIIEALEKQKDAAMILELRQLFETADLVKFAKFSVLLNENDMNLVNALQFVNTTKIEEKPEDKKPEKPQLTAEEKQRQTWRTVYQWTIGVLSAAALGVAGYAVWYLLGLL